MNFFHPLKYLYNKQYNANKAEETHMIGKADEIKKVNLIYIFINKGIIIKESKMNT
jgi:hypothetical protein